MRLASGYNIFCILVPLALAWVAKFEVLDWGKLVTFVRKCPRPISVRICESYLGFRLVCFIAMIPLQKTLDWGAEQMGLFLGKELSDLLVITLSKYVRTASTIGSSSRLTDPSAIEAALAVILLFKCEYVFSLI